MSAHLIPVREVHVLSLDCPCRPLVARVRRAPAVRHRPRREVLRRAVAARG